MFIPAFASHGIADRQKQLSLFESKPLSKAISIAVVGAKIRHSRKTHGYVIQIPEPAHIPRLLRPDGTIKKMSQPGMAETFLGGQAG
jgi:hypothetical protein